MHHIISQAKAKKLDRLDLITNAGNIVEICVDCHNLTDTSLFRNWIERTETGKKPKGRRRTREEVRLHRKRKREKKGLFQCSGHIKSGRRCEVGVTEKGGYCSQHGSQR